MKLSDDAIIPTRASPGCAEDETTKECHFAWYEVDELEDAMSRYYPDQR